MRLGLTAIVDQLLPILGRRLVQAIENETTCDRRFTAKDPVPSVVESALTARIHIKAEQWACVGVARTKIAEDAGVVRAAVAPTVVDGALRLDLSDFGIDDLGALARSLGVEAMAEREVQGLLDDFNADARLTKLPPSFLAAGYSYRRVSVGRDSAGRAVLAAEAHGPADLKALIQAIGPVMKRLKR